MQSFLILGLMPFFRIAEYDVKTFDPDAIFAEYIRGFRDYGRFSLRPIAIKYHPDRSVSDGWTTSASANGSVAVSARQSLYLLTLSDPNLRASDVTDCLIGMRALMYDFVAEENVLIRCEANDIPASQIISLDEATSLYCRAYQVRTSDADPPALFMCKETRGDEWDEKLWSLVSSIIGDEQVVYAALFLRSALEHLMFFGDDFTRTILRQEEKAERIREAVDIENSIHNCYKVIEAVYGGALPRDWEQIVRRFQNKGIDLLEEETYVTEYGVFGNEPLLEKLKRLQVARNDRSAHGRIHANRRSTYYELMDYQVLAGRVLKSFIAHKYPNAPL
jgi:hypothetical protein